MAVLSPRKKGEIASHFGSVQRAILTILPRRARSATRMTLTQRLNARQKGTPKRQRYLAVPPPQRRARLRPILARFKGQCSPFFRAECAPLPVRLSFKGKTRCKKGHQKGTALGGAFWAPPLPPTGALEELRERLPLGERRGAFGAEELGERRRTPMLLPYNGVRARFGKVLEVWRQPKPWCRGTWP